MEKLWNFVILEKKLIAFIKTQVHTFLLTNNSQVLLEFNEFSIIFFAFN